MADQDRLDRIDQLIAEKRQAYLRYVTAFNADGAHQMAVEVDQLLDLRHRVQRNQPDGVEPIRPCAPTAS